MIRSTPSKTTEIMSLLATPTLSDNNPHLANPFWAATHAKELKDSMHSASYIQQSIFGLPSDFEKKIEYECFLFHSPKEVVSGDFYWSYKILDKLIVIVGDCTGHGIPGALLTIFAHSALYKTVVEARITDPGEILTKVSALFSETFALKKAVTGIGMDASVCVIDTRTKKLEFAGAGNPVWITRDNDLLEIKGDRFSVGSYYESPVKFTTQRIALRENDAIYLFTDGYEDQFGGNQTTNFGGKKFLKKRFKKTVWSMSDLSMDQQKINLALTLDDWKKDFEQIDDVCVLGLKIS
ncbi:MAG: PP2C family protein-serine/threonine phosphatase [Flavobacteriales bacterium]